MDAHWAPAYGTRRAPCPHRQPGTYFVGRRTDDAEGNWGLGEYYAVPGWGMWCAKFVKGEDGTIAAMIADMTKCLVTEEEMYDHPLYPAEAPRPPKVLPRTGSAGV